MDALQNFFIHAVIIILMAPLLVFYGLPFVFVAKVFNHYGKLWYSDKARFILACGIASIGIAPAFDRYRAPMPIYYTWLTEGTTVSLGYMVVSFLVTWVVVMEQTKTLSRLFGHKH